MWEQQAKNAKAEVEKLKKELADARTATEVAEAEVKRVREEEKEKLRATNLKGFEAGIKRAALEYTQIAHKMVNDKLEMRLLDFHKLGYAVGADAMAGVMSLPPKEDEDEEMIDATHAKQLGGIGDHVAEVDKRDKSAEADAQDKATEDEIHDID
ncbi:hypothetical protein RHGRI_011301 [Rhododendron griersonianum]|uniref:Uncharacterized protein n=1 Tax=Rhododendron griersonianum TaxID=479676 RepID=A0AAV6KL95_9ERIC|nr:hypothetical protein RHGRI_011301 [Rhododendron griersonianum]